jgi:hypothetical protein
MVFAEFLLDSLTTLPTLLGKGFVYVDPGTGSYLFQVALAGVLGVLFTFRSFWRGLRAQVARWVFGQAKGDPQRDETA